MHGHVANDDHKHDDVVDLSLGADLGACDVASPQAHEAEANKGYEETVLQDHSLLVVHVLGEHADDHQGREEGGGVAIVEDEVSVGELVAHDREVPAMCLFALSSTSQKPPGGASPAVKVAVATSDVRSSSQARKSCWLFLSKKELVGARL